MITKLSKPGITLIDYACGKAGDLPKWINSNLSYVLGIDVSRDNVHNKLDGACARYMNVAKDNKKIPDALFLVGNTSLNIKTSDNDENGNPLGFNTTVTASEAGMGSLTITLVHEGPKPNNGLEEALTTGVSDIQKTFEFTVTE